MSGILHEDLSVFHIVGSSVCSATIRSAHCFNYSVDSEICTSTIQTERDNSVIGTRYIVTLDVRCSYFLVCVGKSKSLTVQFGSFDYQDNKVRCLRDCSLVGKYPLFGGNRCLHLQGRRELFYS